MFCHRGISSFIKDGTTDNLHRMDSLRPSLLIIHSTRQKYYVKWYYKNQARHAWTNFETVNFWSKLQSIYFYVKLTEVLQPTKVAKYETWFLLAVLGYFNGSQWLLIVSPLYYSREQDPIVSVSCTKTAGKLHIIKKPVTSKRNMSLWLVVHLFICYFDGLQPNGVKQWHNFFFQEGGAFLL